MTNLSLFGLFSFITYCAAGLYTRCVRRHNDNVLYFMLILYQVRDLEAELDLEQRRARDAAAENKKLQKQLADLRTQADDDHRMVAELSDEVSTLQMKIVTLKRQLDENVRLLPTLTSFYLATVAHSKQAGCMSMPSSFGFHFFNLFSMLKTGLAASSKSP